MDEGAVIIYFSLNGRPYLSLSVSAYPSRSVAALRKAYLVEVDALYIRVIEVICKIEVYSVFSRLERFGDTSPKITEGSRRRYRWYLVFQR